MPEQQEDTLFNGSKDSENLEEPTKEEFENEYGEEGIDTDPKPDSDGNQPSAVVRISPIKFTVWDNEYGYNFVPTRVYVADRDDNGDPTDFEEVNSYRLEDLKKLSTISDKLYQELAIKIEKWDI